MATPDEYSAILSGETRPVDVAAVELELTQLWKAAAEDTTGSQPVVRACVLNLVAFATGEDVAQHINEIIAQVSGRHPSRSIVIVADPDAKDDRLEASISAHCQIPTEGGKQVCSEQITLNASGATVDELHGTVLPLLIPDLPVFLWWHDEPSLEEHLFRELLEACDHLVIDSADFVPERAASVLADLQKITQIGHVPLSDLNWSRLTHWREMVAQFFDAEPARRYIDHLDRIRVEIASIHGLEPDLTEGLLVVGWMASRLGWTLDNGAQQPARNGIAFSLSGPSGSVAVELSPDPSHPGEGLHSLSLEAGRNVTFSVSRKTDDEACVVATAELPDVAGQSRVVRMDLPSEAALLCDELDMLSRDEVFDQALELAVRFMKGVS